MSVFPEVFAALPLEGRPETAVTKVLMPLLSGNPKQALEFVSTRRAAWMNCVRGVPPEVRSQLNEYFAGYEEAEETYPELDELRKILKLAEPKKKPAEDISKKGQSETNGENSGFAGRRRRTVTFSLSWAVCFRVKAKFASASELAAHSGHSRREQWKSPLVQRLAKQLYGEG